MEKRLLQKQDELQKQFSDIQSKYLLCFILHLKSIYPLTLVISVQASTEIWLKNKKIASPLPR